MAGRQMGGIVFASGRLHACVQHGTCGVRAAERRFRGDRREADRARRGDSLPVTAGFDTKVAELYGMIRSGATATVRAVFLLDPKRVCC